MVDNPLMIWSCYDIGSGNRTDEDPKHCLDVWKDRNKFLESKGIKLKLIVPKKSLRMPGIFSVLDVLEREHPDWLVESPGIRKKGSEIIYDRRIAWPRDNFQIFGDTVYTPIVDFEHTSYFFGNLGINSEVKASRIGEGGFSVKANGTVIVADYPDILDRDIQEVEAKGYRVFQMPTSNFENFSGEQAISFLERISKNRHLDTELNCAETPSGNLVLVVTQDYYRAFRSQVKDLRKKTDAKLRVLKDQREIAGKAVNFVQLPDKTVLTSQNYSELPRLLRKDLGKDRVHQIETFPGEYTFLNGGGGLRCRTNFVY